jgi:hypothetical protein
MAYLRTDASFAHAAQYRQLWKRYTDSMAEPPTTRDQLHAALEGWHEWASDAQHGLTPQQQQQLTAGPAAEITTWRRATIDGVKFREEDMDPTDSQRLAKKSLGSYFLARTQYTSADGSAGYRFQLGRAVFFIEHSPPGAADDSTMQEFVCAKWALVPSPSHTASGLPMVVLDRWRAATPTKPYVCPVVPLKTVEPCHVGLGVLDSRHGVPRQVKADNINNSQLLHYRTGSAVYGTAEDESYCARLAAAAQAAGTRPTCSQVRLAAVLTPYCWMCEKFVSS